MKFFLTGAYNGMGSCRFVEGAGDVAERHA